VHLDTAAAERGEPFGGQLGLGQLFGKEDLRGRRHRLAVELADERGEDLAVAPPGDPIEEERLLPDEPALAYEEQLDAGVTALPDDADHVLVHVVGRDDLLTLPDLVEGLDLIAQHRGALELELGGGLLHLLGEPARQLLVPALEEVHDVLHRLRVALPGFPARAGRVAAMDRVLDAGPLERAVDRDRARPEGEELAREPERFAHRRGRIERTVVLGAVALDPPRHQEPRKRLVRGELQERIVLVVAQDDVVAGPVLAHQVGLEHEGLELVVGDDVLEVADLADQRVGLGIARARLLEV